MRRSSSCCCVILCLAALGALAGCAPDTLPPTEGSAASASPTTGGPVGGTPEPDSEPAAHAQADNAATQYSCNNGDTITVRYPSAGHAVIHFHGQDRPMHIAISASGARYVGKNYEWWTRGNGHNAKATLFVHTDNGSTGRVVTICRQQ